MRTSQKLHKRHVDELKMNKSHAYEPEASQTSCVRGDGFQKLHKRHVYEVTDCRIHKSRVCKQELHKSHVYEVNTHKTRRYELKSHERHACDLKIRKSCAYELKIRGSRAYELKECKIRSHVVRPSVMTHSCNQLLRIQYTATELLSRQERSQFPYHVGLPSLRK